MKNFLVQYKKMLPTKKKEEKRDFAKIMKRVDAQIGRAVTRLSER